MKIKLLRKLRSKAWSLYYLDLENKQYIVRSAKTYLILYRNNERIKTIKALEMFFVIDIQMYISEHRTMLRIKSFLSKRFNL